ncbi:FixH family protein [Niabella yanshanensis]|uniref:FixH family protein n=1 Tax=Niabella yanshanensis TaxID=577386 RepID=A0ABZ0WBR7_9BACT|nr:FixH family protein [Niabella yanshanensis]WQD39989.1 FixH family protein [Niabella yanshanensis]
MSWGNRVIIILVVFVAGITFMVYLSMRQTNEVVDANYYEREMKYQQVIDGKKNLLALGDSVTIMNDGAVIKVAFPPSTITRLDSGSIQFMKLSNAKDDKFIPMSGNKTALYQIPLSYISKGLYKVRIDWSNQGTPYYHEQSFNIQ